MGVGAEDLRCWDTDRCCDAVRLGPHFESHCCRILLKRHSLWRPTHTRTYTHVHICALAWEAAPATGTQSAWPFLGSPASFPHLTLPFELLSPRPAFLRQNKPRHRPCPSLPQGLGTCCIVTQTGLPSTHVLQTAPPAVPLTCPLIPLIGLVAGRSQPLENVNPRKARRNDHSAPHLGPVPSTSP